MRVLLINPPHPSIGSRIPREQLPPLGLLSVGGPLIDDGHDVELIDAEFGPMPLGEIVQRAAAKAPHAVLLGHSGSTSGHPIAAELTRLLRAALPRTAIVYGGVFPTYHWREILAEEPQIDVIVRGEGEAIIVALMRALEAGMPLDRIAGIAYRVEGIPTATPPAPVIRDREAIRLLRRHDILSMATWVVGFEDETAHDLIRGLRQLISYDPDQIQALYVTPHRWTPFFRLAASRRVVQTDQRRWDYKHQVLHMRHMAPWRLLVFVKCIEALVQLRPKALWRVLAHRDRKIRHAMRWYTRMGRRVWPHEIWNFFVRDRRTRNGPTLAEFWGAPQDAEENSMQRVVRGQVIPLVVERKVPVAMHG